MEVIILLVVVAALDRASLRWGSDSNDGIDGPEWSRRQRWYGFHQNRRRMPRPFKAGEECGVPCLEWGGYSVCEYSIKV
jgi:hypothetical protein